MPSVPALALLLLQARGQAPTPAAQPTPPVAGCTVEGAVYSAATGERLKKAAVALRGSENRRDRNYGVVTDASGAFFFRSVEPGKYRLTAERVGFARTEFGAPKPGGTGSILTLEAGCALRDLAIRLIATPVVTGRVLDREGDPVPYARVTAFGARIVSGRRRLFPAGVAATNDLGEYRLFGILPGRYYLQAMHMNSMRGQAFESTGESSAPTYYPRAADLGTAVPLELAPGQEARSIDITLLSVRTIRVRGKLSMGGRGARVFLAPREAGEDRGMGGPRAMVDGEGRFEIRDVVPGSYELVAGASAQGKAYSASMPLEAGAADIDGLILTLAPAADVAATTRVEEPLKLASIAQVAVRLESRGGGRGVQGRAQKEGPVVFREIEAGEYEISVSNLPDDVYLAAARSGGVDVLESGLDLRRGPPPGPIELTFSPAGGRVSGTVLDAKKTAAAGAYAVLVPAGKPRARASLFRTAAADSSGRYEFRGVAPASYTLFAWDSLDEIPYREADFLAKVETFGVSVKIEREGREIRDLTLIEGR